MCTETAQTRFSPFIKNKFARFESSRYKVEKLQQHDSRFDILLLLSNETTFIHFLNATVHVDAAKWFILVHQQINIKHRASLHNRDETTVSHYVH